MLRARRLIHIPKARQAYSRTYWDTAESCFLVEYKDVLEVERGPVWLTADQGYRQLQYLEASLSTTFAPYLVSNVFVVISLFAYLGCDFSGPR
jgi:hypothetical protein